MQKAMARLTAAKRPAETVRAYLESEFLSGGATEPIRLPTIKEFSKHLEISASTVRTVFKELSDEGRLTMVAGRGTFLVPGKSTVKTARHNCLGINMPKTIIEGWGGTIFLGAAAKALKENMTLTALGHVRNLETTSEETLAALDQVDAMIAFPDGGHSHEVDRLCAQKNIPVIHINPSGFQATANFVSNDYFAFCYQLALAWCETGRKHIALLNASSVNDSVSAAQTYAAFSLAVASYSEVHLNLLGNVSAETTQKTGYDLLKKFLTTPEGSRVDAVYGFGDYLAEGAAQALLDAGRSIPSEVSVVGGTGLKPIRLSCGNLVTMKQPMQEIGKVAATMAITRIRQKGMAVPGRYIMPTLSEGTTILTEEREAFQRLLTQEKELI